MTTSTSNLTKTISIQEKFVRIIEGYKQDWKEPENGNTIFGPALTVWLWMLQIMNGETMSEALSRMKDGEANLVATKSGIGEQTVRDISSNTGGYSRARSRLPEEDVEDIAELIAEVTRESIKGTEAEKQKIYDIDGTLVTLSNTPSNSREYPHSRGQRGEYNHPLIRIVFASDLHTGVCVKPVYGAYRGENAQSEQRLGCQVIDGLEPNSLIVGDRNFGVFSVIAHAQQQSKEVLFRLSATQAHKFLKGEKKKGEVDKIVQWQKSYRDTLLSESDDIIVEGRFVRTTLKRKGFSPMVLWFFTTSKLAVTEIVELYGKRVYIETDIRSLKSLFKLEQLQVKTPEMVRKHLHILFATYNLLRVIIARTAKTIGVEPRKISFKSAVTYVKVYGKKMLAAQNKQELQEYQALLATSLRQTLLPNRTSKRHEPRMLTRRRSAFPVMRSDRAAVKKRLNLP